MKLATYKDGSRDGQLVVVSRDLSQAHYASHIANRLQVVLDDWNYLAPLLQDLFDALNHGRARHAFPFDPTQCMAPLPRAFQWIDSVAYADHAELLHKARGAELPETLRNTPLMAQGASDALLGACDPIVAASTDFGVDFGAGLAVVSGDIPMGCTAERALDGVRLLMLVNSVTLRHLGPVEPCDAYGWLHSKPTAACAPVAVTPDELGDAWARGRVQLPLQSTWNGRKVGLGDAGADMTFHFGQLMAYAAKTRPLRAGSIIASGPVSQKGVSKGAGAKAQTDWPHGYHSIAEKRAMETLQDGAPRTAYLQYGDTIRIDMRAPAGHSVFGAIEQEVIAPSV